MKYNVFPLFPSCVHVIEGENIAQEQLVKYAYSEKKKDPLGVGVKSNRGGWQSKPHYNQTNNIIIETVKAQIGKYFRDNKVTKNGWVVDINTLWININKKGDHNIKHSHPGSDLAGVMWIKAPENCGRLNFDSPYVFNYYRELKCYSDSFGDNTNAFCDYYFVPQEGTILLFPAHLLHWVAQNETNEDRISVSFNIALYEVNK